MSRATKSHTVIIQTPEGISFSLFIASPVSRFLAWLIDCLIIYALVYVLQILSLLLLIISVDFSSAFFILMFFLSTLLYRILMEWYCRGQTIGKKVMKLRVMDIEGMKIQFSQIVVRNLLRFVDFFPMFYFVGGISCLFSKYGQRLGDIAANTMVIRNADFTPPEVSQINGGKYNSLKAFPHLAARLRQNISASEASLVLQALSRRDQLEPVERLKLFEEISSYFKAKVVFPGEAIEGLSDEQYLRNLAEILYQ